MSTSSNRTPWLYLAITIAVLVAFVAFVAMREANNKTEFMKERWEESLTRNLLMSPWTTFIGKSDDNSTVVQYDIKQTIPYKGNTRWYPSVAFSCAGSGMRFIFQMPDDIQFKVDEDARAQITISKDDGTKIWEASATQVVNQGAIERQGWVVVWDMYDLEPILDDDYPTWASSNSDVGDLSIGIKVGDKGWETEFSSRKLASSLKAMKVGCLVAWLDGLEEGGGLSKKIREISQAMKLGKVFK